MSLQIWLPLNGNLRNQGCGEVQVTGGTAQYLDTGKLGKCANLASRVIFYSSALANMTNENFSVAFWVRTDASSTLTGDWVDIMGMQDLNTNKSGTGTFRFAACYSSNLRACSWHDNANDNIISGSITCVPDSEKGKWHHVCVTMSNGSSVTYRDGVNIGTKATVAGGYFNGILHIGETNAIAGGIADLRIYNHALSVAEVKELAKGLVCHYKLDDYNGLPNLVSNSKTFSGWSVGSGWTQVATDNNSVGYRFTRTGATSNNWVRLIPTLKVNGNDYPNGITVSLDLLTPSKAAINQKCIGSLQTYQENGSRIGWFEPGWDMTNVVDGEWSRVSFTFSKAQLLTNNTSGTTYSYTQFSFQLVQNGDITIRNIKIENGGVSTLYIPNSSDAEYKALGYDSTTIVDCSGNGYNATKGGTLTASTNTPRYSLSTVFATSSGCFSNPNIVLSQFTISFWGKHTAANKMLMGSNASLSSTNSDWYWFGDNSFKYPSGEFYYAHNAGSAESLLGTWIHFVAVYDGTNITIYRNGVNEGSKATTGDMTLTYLSIGMGYNQSSYWAGGSVSDFRLYATTLSADDIKALYNIGARIAKNGSMLSYEIKEVD